jgi:vacuolar-type H+-ATPase subunit E/Vma4
MPAECLVHVAEQDKPFLSEQLLQEAVTPWGQRVQLRVGEPAAISGGVVVESADGRKRYDNSFEAQLKRGHARWRARVYQLLQGENGSPTDRGDRKDSGDSISPMTLNDGRDRP